MQEVDCGNDQQCQVFMDTLTSPRIASDVVDIIQHSRNSKVAKVISDEMRLIFEVVNFVTLCTIIGMFGIFSNIINIIVFSKQGFNNTVNISFLGLAISDLCCLITLQWVCICFNPLFARSGVPWMADEIEYLTGAWPHVCFGRITNLLTAYVTGERCLCIAIPLKVKQIITPRRTTAAVVVIYFINLATLVPEYATSYIDWKFYPARNANLLGLVFTSNRKYVEGLVFILNSTLGMASFVAVIVFTIILIVKLKYSSAWRKKASTHHDKRETASNREKKTVVMVLLIAIILIVCYTPGIIVCLTTFVVAEFYVLGGYINICMACWSFVFVFQTINSSVNIFLYYSMSSSYKVIFDELFFRKAALN